MQRLDQLQVVEHPSQSLPHLVPDSPVGVKLIGGEQQGCAAFGPTLYGGADSDTRNLLLGQPRIPGQALMLGPLVVAARVVRYPQDHELGVPTRQPAARHQHCRESQPATEEPAMPGKRAEDVRRISPNRRAGELDDPPVHPSELANATGMDTWTVAFPISRSTLPEPL